MLVVRAAALLLLIGSVLGEAVKECIPKGSFAPASCQEIRDKIPGKWVELRHLTLPLNNCVSERYSEIRKDGKCAVHTFEKAGPGALALGHDFEIKSSALSLDQLEMQDLGFKFWMSLEPSSNDTCDVTITLDCKLPEQMKRLEKMWFSFYQDDIMIGYTCINNNNPMDVLKGKLKKHLVIAYARPNILTGKQAKQEAFRRVAKVIEHKTQAVEADDEHDSLTLKESQCNGL